MRLTFQGKTNTGLTVAEKLCLEEGRIVALTGSSGSGKSRLLRALADLDPSELKVMLDEVSVSAMQAVEWRRRVSYVSPTAHWWAGERLEQVLATPQARALGQLLALPFEKESLPMTELSTGEQQRAHLARALSQESSRVLLLDEPTSALDDENKRNVEAVLRDRAHSGIAILMVSHDQEQVARLADHHWHIAADRLEVRA